MQFRLSKMKAAALVAGALVMAATPARAEGRLERAKITNVAATATFTFAENDTVFSSFQPIDLVFGLPASSTSNVMTVYYTIGTAITNIAATKTVTATDRKLSITNIPPAFSGDRLIVGSADTNTFSSYFIYRQQ